MVSVEVTAEDINEGKQMNIIDCPLARALYRATGTVYKVRTYTIADEYDRIYNLPIVARDFRSDFDAGLPTTPFTFMLDISKKAEWS